MARGEAQWWWPGRDKVVVVPLKEAKASTLLEEAVEEAMALAPLEDVVASVRRWRRSRCRRQCWSVEAPALLE
jgi:hypothetical protein